MTAGAWRFARLLVAASALVLGGCGAAVVIPNIQAAESVFKDRSRVGILVVLPEQPTVNTGDQQRGGAVGKSWLTGGSLLTRVIVNAAAGKLEDHAKTLPMDDLRAVQQELERALRQRGVDSRIIGPERAKDYRGWVVWLKNEKHQMYDMRELGEEFGIDRLLVVSIFDLGFNYPREGLMGLESGDPMAWVAGEAYLLDLQGRSFLWYRKLRTLRGVGKDWDHPPDYKALTAKYFEALEVTKEELLADLLRQP